LSGWYSRTTDACPTRGKAYGNFVQNTGRVKLKRSDR
jgi:hypothetical protein